MAVRYDRYLDTDSSVTPQLGLKISPFGQNRFYLRGSIGTGFKAPNLSDLNTKPFFYMANMYDKEGCENEDLNQRLACRVSPRHIEKRGNPNLKSEKALNYVVGIGIIPTANATITLDYWETLVKNRIADYNLHIVSDLILRGHIEPEHTILDFKRDETGNLIKIISPRANIGRIKRSGLDLTTRYRNFIFPSSSIYFSTGLYIDAKQKIMNSSPWVSALRANRQRFPRYRYLLAWNMKVPWLDKVSFQIRRQTISSYADIYGVGAINEDGTLDQSKRKQHHFAISSSSRYDFSLVAREVFTRKDLIKFGVLNAFYKSRPRPVSNVKRPEMEYHYPRYVHGIDFTLYTVHYRLNF